MAANLLGMKVLIIDRDRLAAQPLLTQLEAMGHEVVHESVRRSAMDLLNSQPFDVIFIDPAPLPSVREITLPLRWEQRDDYFYLVLTGHHSDPHEVLRSGMNAKIAKPFDPNDVKHTMKNAERLIDFMKRLRHGDASGTDNRIFGQRGFCQLVLSALDRAYRYNEQAYLLVMQLTNFDAIAATSGANTANGLLHETGLYLSKLHRMSDFLGHTSHTEYVLLILRPAADSEPQDAAERFELALRDFQDRFNLPVKPEFSLELWSLPSANVKVKVKTAR